MVNPSRDGVDGCGKSSTSEARQPDAFRLSGLGAGREEEEVQASQRQQTLDHIILFSTIKTVLKDGPIVRLSCCLLVARDDADSSWMRYAPDHERL